MYCTAARVFDPIWPSLDISSDLFFSFLLKYPSKNSQISSGHILSNKGLFKRERGVNKNGWIKGGRIDLYCQIIFDPNDPIIPFDWLFKIMFIAELQFHLVCSTNYDCQKGKYQSGHEIQHTTEYSSNQCAKRCCLHSYCVGYYWERDTMRCSLTKSSGMAMKDSHKYSYCEKQLGKLIVQKDHKYFFIAYKFSVFVCIPYALFGDITRF